MADTASVPVPAPVEAPKDALDVPQHRFEGYTLADIRYRRALMTLKKEFCRDKMAHDLASARQALPFLGSQPQKGAKKSGFSSTLGPIAGKIFSGLNYIDYAMIGFQTFKTIRKVFSLFHRSKK